VTLSGFADRLIENGLDWEEAISFVKSHTNLELWIKGRESTSRGRKTMGLTNLPVYTAEDVVTAIQYGVDGVVISNHGGRQLDSVPATLDALRECAPVAKGKIKIAIDGGIRRGTDIFKALALGADFCFAGRIPIWGLAVSSQVVDFVCCADRVSSTTATRVSSLPYSSCMMNSG
jgi:(S)-2-hydroxy-acid oxidase